MIEVKGPNVFKGYWRMPEKTREEFRDDGFFITGDLGKIDERGYVTHRRPRQGPDHLRRLQRLSQGSRGAEIDALPGVVESAVIGVPHPDFGEGVTAVVVPRTKGAALDEACGLKALDGRLAKFKLPKRVHRRRRTAAQHHGQGAEVTMITPNQIGSKPSAGNDRPERRSARSAGSSPARPSPRPGRCSMTRISVSTPISRAGSVQQPCAVKFCVACVITSQSSRTDRRRSRW
jgi:hypothetical protein